MRNGIEPIDKLAECRERLHAVRVGRIKRRAARRSDRVGWSGRAQQKATGADGFSVRKRPRAAGLLMRVAAAAVAAAARPRPSPNILCPPSISVATRRPFDQDGGRQQRSARQQQRRSQFSHWRANHPAGASALVPLQSARARVQGCRQESRRLAWNSRQRRHER